MKSFKSAMGTSSSMSRKNVGNVATMLVMGLVFVELSCWSGCSVEARREHRFSFPFFNSSSLADLRFFDDAPHPSPGDSFIDLVPTSPSWNRSGFTKGKVMYKDPVQMTDAEADMVASWNTSFTVQMTRANQSDSRGGADGLAFVIVGSPNVSGDPAGDFGIFKNYTSITPTFAVELDTWQNKQFHDGEPGHVGIDISSTTSLYDKPAPMSLNNGSKIRVWIEYNHPTTTLEIRLSLPDDRTRPSGAFMTVTDLDLGTVMVQKMWVGFGAGSSDKYQFHTIHDWMFYSKLDKSAGLSIQSTPPSNVDTGSPTPAPTDNSTTTTKPKPKLTKPTVWLWVLISLAVVAGVPACLASALCCTKRRSHKVQALGSQNSISKDNCENDKLDILVDSPHSFSYSQLREATDDFSETLKLGSGGFGTVFRGVIRCSGKEVAVKRLSHDSKQGEREFLSEIVIISRLRHRNLVQLLGWCQDDKSKELLLVYELQPHGSLDKLLLNPRDDEPGVLSWSQRSKILKGIASALEYLHEGSLDKVIHRDVKCSNVMLDGNYYAKLGDFGLARLMDHAPYTTRPAGSLGYMAPEIFQTGKATEKSDVYSFGAVALEVVCGKKAFDMKLWGVSDDGFLVDWVWGLFGETDVKNPDRILEAVDVTMKEAYDIEEVRRVLQVGLLCSHPLPDARPSMRQIVHFLAGEAVVPPVPKTKPVPVYTTSTTVDAG